MKRFARLLLLALSLVPLAAGATIYRWTDKEGVIHFSDAPPKRGKGAPKAGTITPGAAGNTMSLAAPRHTSRGPNKKAVDTFTKPAPDGPALEMQTRNQDEVRKASCQDARRRLNYVRVSRIVYENDAKGNARLLSDMDRRVAERALSGEVDFWCKVSS